MADTKVTPVTVGDVSQADGDMATEPAMTIAQLLGSKAMLKTYIAAILAIMATFFKFAVDGAMVENLATVVQLVALLATPFMAQFEQKQRAIEQGKVTREAVFAPSSVKKIIEDTQGSDSGIPVSELSEEIGGVLPSTDKPTT